MADGKHLEDHGKNVARLLHIGDQCDDGAAAFEGDVCDALEVLEYAAEGLVLDTERPLDVGLLHLHLGEDVDILV